MPQTTSPALGRERGGASRTTRGANHGTASGPVTRPSAPGSPALVAAWQGDHDKGPGRHAHLSALPAFVVHDVGLTSHKGARLELAVLSGFLHWSALPANNEPRTLEYDNGEDSVRLGAGEFVVSLQSVAEDVYDRFFGRSLPANPLSDPDFKAFYSLARAAKDRLLTKGYLRRIDYAVPAKLGVLGTVWTLKGTPLEGYGSRRLPEAPLLLFGGPHARPVDNALTLNDEAWVNCVDRLALAFRISEIRKGRLRYTEVCNRLDTAQRRDAPMFGDAVRNARAMGRGVVGERHQRVGAWERGRECDAEAPVRVPWVPLEIDDDTFTYSLAHARVLIEHLWDEYEVEGVTVAHSGRRSAHVRVPSAAFGDPVFRDAKTAHRVLSTWARRLCEEAGVNPSVVDKGPLNPLNTLRLPGSTRRIEDKREVHLPGGRVERVTTGYREARCTVLPAEAALSCEDEGDWVRALHAHESRHGPYVLPDPTSAPLSSPLALSLAAACDEAFGPPAWVGPGGLILWDLVPDVTLGGGTGGAWAEMCDGLLRDGVDEGQEFECGDGRSWAGRTMAAFFLAGHLVRLHGEAEGWARLEQWNASLPSPLRPHELVCQWRGAMKEV